MKRWLPVALATLLAGGPAWAQDDDESVIDVAVFYTTAAKNAEGGTTQIEAEIDKLVAATNMAYANSDVNQRINLVWVQEVNQTEVDLDTDVARLRNSDQVKTIRNQVWADLVVLLRAGAGGTATIDGAFSGSQVHEGVFAHELGHNMGLHHDRYVACTSTACELSGPRNYAYGYVNQKAFVSGAATKTQWRTIMSYNNQCAASGFNCTQILRFSNPNQTYVGDPLGVAFTTSNQFSIAVDGPADAVRRLNETRASVADYREGRGVKLSFSEASYTATEGGTAAQVKVEFGAVPGRDLRIPLKVATTDAGPGDYTLSPTELHIASSDTDASATVTVTAVDDSVDENAESVTLSFGDVSAHGVTVGSQATTKVVLADNDTVSGAPGIESLAVTSDPGPDAIYAVEEEIVVTVAFDKVVAVTGTPQLALTMDSGSPRQAEYSGGLGEVLRFTYAVADGDSAADGFSIAADSLSLNGGSILDDTDTGTSQAADRSHAALDAGSGHVVDGRRPVLQTAGVDGFWVTLTYDEILDDASAPASSAFTVTADNGTLAVDAVAVSGVAATLTLASQVAAGQTVELDYTPPATAPLQDPVGNAAVALSGRALTNTTPEAVYDDDGLIDVGSLVQLDAVRHDLDGDGTPSADGATAYAAAFPEATRVVCGVSSGCAGYELLADLDFHDTDGDGDVDADDDRNADGSVDAEDTAYWNGGAGWLPIGATEHHEFGATFEGNGHTIGHLFAAPINGRNVGLFGRTKPPGVIRHVGLTDAVVEGSSQIGGLVGSNAGVVFGSHVAGRVRGENTDTGGLVGANAGTVHASYATGRVTGGVAAGGLVGRNSGAIRAGYSTALVTGVSEYARSLGGLVGELTETGSIVASYAAGPVRNGARDLGGLAGKSNGGTITDSYWDTHISAITLSFWGIGKTTADLQTPTGHTAGGIYANWDVDLDGDATGDGPWHIGTAAQYPALQANVDGDDEATWEEFGHQLRPGVTLTATTAPGEVGLSWTAPAPTVTYTVYRGVGTPEAVLVEGLAGTTYTDADVAGATTYAYQVAAVVSGGEAAWSGPQTATVANSAPVFDANSGAMRSVPENSPPGTDVGTPAKATDAEAGDTLTYSLEGTDAAAFAIVAETGQIRTKAGVAYDHETKPGHQVTVKVEDDNGATATVAVEIAVTDVDEQPETPTTPTAVPTPGQTDSLDVGWPAPGLNGGPALTGYELHYRQRGSETWIAVSHSGTGTTATIGSLTADIPYEVRVRALNGETPSEWSPTETGWPGTNRAPTFANATEARSLAENTVAVTDLGAAVVATDPDVGDTPTYSLEGADAGSFDIVAASGQIRTRSGTTYDYETQPTYRVTVKADDGRGGRATVPVTISLTDVDEQPETPAAPMVTATQDTRGYPRQPGRDVDGAGTERRACPDGLQAALPKGHERELDGAVGDGDEHQRNDRVAAGGPGLRGAGAGAERRDAERVVALGDGLDDAEDAGSRRLGPGSRRRVGRRFLPAAVRHPGRPRSQRRGRGKLQHDRPGCGGSGPPGHRRPQRRIPRRRQHGRHRRPRQHRDHVHQRLPGGSHLLA